MAKQQKSKIKLSLKRIVSNNLFMLKIIHKSAPGLLAINTLFNLFYSAVDFVSSTLLLRYIINGIGNGLSFSGLTVALIIYIAIYLVTNLISNWYHQSKYQLDKNEIHRSVHNLVYKKASVVELACYENPKFYDTFCKAIAECTMRTDEVLNSISQISYILFRFSANFGLLIAIDPKLLLFVLLPLVTIPLNAKANKLAYQRTTETREVNRHRDYSKRTFYLADYAKEMRLTNMPSLLLKRFREAGNRNMFILKKYGKGIAAIYYLISIINEVFTALGATIYAVWNTLGTGTMGYGDCVVVVNSIEGIAYTLTDSSSVFLRFQENALYIEDLRKFLNYEPKLVDGNTELSKNGNIVLNNVSFKYDGAENYTLKNLNMSFGAKEKVAIVGHNGAGKTTLVKLLLRLYDAEGEITYGGVNIKDFRVDEYRDIFSAVMQDAKIFALSVEDNVFLRNHDKETKEDAITALKKGGIYDKVKDFSKGIDTVLTKEFCDEGELLSGGEQQKLAISHVYSKQNKFVILDEPSSALDPIAEDKMYKTMFDACKDCGMIFISHRMSAAVTADKVYLMENGEVLESGTHQELMDLGGTYAKMFLRQAENYRDSEEAISNA